MREYELLKDLPGIPKGSICIQKAYNYWIINGSEYSTISRNDPLNEIARKKINTLNDALNVGGRLRERYNTAYNGMYFGDDDTPPELIAEPKVSFSEESQVRTFSKKMDAMKAVWERHAENDGDFEPDWEDDNQKKLYLYYDYDLAGEWNFGIGYFNQCNYFLPYFSSKEKAEQCIEELGEQLDDLLL